MSIPFIIQMLYFVIVFEIFNIVSLITGNSVQTSNFDSNQFTCYIIKFGKFSERIE